MFGIENVTVLMLTTCTTLFLISYLSVAFVFYKLAESEIKTLSVLRDPKSFARNRKQIDVSIESSRKEQRLALVWPAFVIRGILNYVKSKLKKEKE